MTESCERFRQEVLPPFRGNMTILPTARILLAKRGLWKHYDRRFIGCNSFLRPCSQRISCPLKKNASIRSFSNNNDKSPANSSSNSNNKEESHVEKDSKAATDISSSAEEPEDLAESFNSVYVHPLSQLVLRHFQTSCHDWIRAKKLDQNLILHRDGTFVLTPPPADDNDGTSSSSSLRIWTYYDGEDRKHWLSVSVNQVHHRFLLQDNLLSAWRGYKRNSLADRVQESVQDLMDAVEELE